jgi:hypothetical protein
MGKNERSMKSQQAFRDAERLKTIPDSVFAESADKEPIVKPDFSYSKAPEKKRGGNECKKCEQAVKAREYAKSRKGVRLKKGKKDENDLFKVGTKLKHNFFPDLTGEVVEITKSKGFKILNNEGKTKIFFNKNNWTVIEEE